MTWHPPVHSPLSPSTLARAALGSLGSGEPRAELTKLLEEEYDASAVVLTDSGTHALQLALGAALASGDAGRVALPAFSCFDLVTAALGAGADMVFYDLDPMTLDPDERSFRDVLGSPGVAAVVVAPLFGRTVPWDRIRAEAREADVLLVEDAAQGVGSSWRGQPAGSLGDLSILSFGRGKGWTGGGGGALLVRTGRVEVKPPVEAPPAGWPILVRSAAQWALGRPSLYGIPSRIPWLGLGETPFHPPSAPRGMAPASARMVLANREPSLRAARIRRANARAILGRLGLDEAAEDPARADGGSHLRLPIRLAQGMETFPDPTAARRLGIIGGYPRVLPSLAATGAEAASAARSWPGAATLVRELITLPTHRWVGPREMDTMVRLLAPHGPLVPDPGPRP